MKKIKSMKTTSERENQPNNYEKPNTSFKPQVNLPRIEAEMSNAEFRKLKTDWEVYKSIIQIPEIQIASQIYTACDSSLQSTIINTVPHFLTLKETELLQKIENIVTRKTNPAVHRLNFRSLSQSEGEQTKNFLVRLKTTAKDCMFECPACKHDLSEMNIRDQLIRGLSNQSLQTDILAKADKLNELDSIINTQRRLRVPCVTKLNYQNQQRRCDSRNIRKRPITETMTYQKPSIETTLTYQMKT